MLVTIESGGSITVYNAVSPNGDGKNETLFIQYIDVIPDANQNNVTIFNRWGDTVFDVSNYDNNDRVFKGVSNSGKDLPSGIYYYKIEFSSGLKSKIGYLSLKR
jgi:gliding motility-associated-like protein